MKEPSSSGAVRKRSQGSLRLHREQGDQHAITVDGPAIHDTGLLNGTSKHSWYRGRSSLITAALFLGTVLVTAFLYQPWFAPFASKSYPSEAHEQPSSPASRPDLDHILRPDEHAHRAPKTLVFDWRITLGSRRPDGVLKEVYLINDEFLGPTIECRSGDRLIIDVHNGLADEGIAIHWHGLSMNGYNDQDGAVGFTQDAIQPGANYTYEFTVDEKQHGTFMYHSHDGLQRADGLFGGLIVHRPAEEGVSDLERFNYAEERLLIIGDWYHRRATEVMEWYMRAASFGNEPVPDSMLINGVGSYNCALAAPARPVDCSILDTPALSLDAAKTYRMRVINAGNLGGFTMKMNAFSMTAITVDGGHEVKGAPARSIGIIYPGQRTDMLLSAIGNTHSLPALSLELDRQNFKYANPALDSEQQYPIDMGDSMQEMKPSKGTGLLQRFDLADVQSRQGIEPAQTAEANLTLVVYSTSVKLAHLDNKPFGFINRTSWKPQAPNLLALPREEWDEHQFIPQLPLASGNENFWIDLVLNNLDDGSHPFHVHGYDMWVLQTHAGFGWGSWNPFEKPEPPGGPLDMQHSVKRDTFVVPKRGYTVLRFKPDNPGIWMFHCHILWHQASGMAMGLEVGGSASALD